MSKPNYEFAETFIPLIKQEAIKDGDDNIYKLADALEKTLTYAKNLEDENEKLKGMLFVKRGVDKEYAK